MDGGDDASQDVASVPMSIGASALATAANHPKPQTSNLVHETADAVTVARDGMIIQPALHNASQPSTRFAKGAVHSLS